MTRSSKFAALALLLVSQLAWAGRIDRDKVWFGVEYTFQDQEMVNETGRNTLTTPYKEQKAIAVANGIAAHLGLSKAAVERKTSWKQGYYVNVPGDGKWVVNPEPVTIEVNTTPRTIEEIEPTAKPIFEATREAGLVAYVNPAAERSGMGHIHVGAAKMGENPFFANPLLLRNVMVYLHKNPALLHGFAEAFDIGMESNIETYHDPARQEAFERAVAEFDAWYDRASPSKRHEQGFNKFIAILSKIDDANWGRVGFFQHYRFMNLEHVQNGNFGERDTGKITIEFRNFRPPKDPATAKAYAELLMAIMEKQSAPDVKEKFEWVTPEEYLRFNTASKVESNWEKVKRELGLENGILDREILEYASAIQRHAYPSIAGADVNLAYSRKNEKGEFFELRIRVSKIHSEPELAIGRQVISFERVQIGPNAYWVGVLDAKAAGVDPQAVVHGSVNGVLRHAPGRCERAFQEAG